MICFRCGQPLELEDGELIVTTWHRSTRVIVDPQNTDPCGRQCDQPADALPHPGVVN